MKTYAVIYQKTDTGYSSYCPDLPGLASCGSTLEDARSMMQEALDFHVEGLLLNGDPLPEPSTIAAMAQTTVDEQTVRLAKTA